MRRNRYQSLRQPVLIGHSSEDVPQKDSTDESDVVALDDRKFLEPVFDEKACASYKLFKEFGLNETSMKTLLWAWYGGDYHKLRKLIVCGLDSSDQQETPARLLFENYGFLSDVHNYIPENAVIIESLPTADSGTDDPSGYIHGIMRSKYPQYKFGFLPVATAETLSLIHI